MTEQALTEPSVEEIVAWAERRLDDGVHPIYLPARLAREIFNDWRKRGESLKRTESELDLLSASHKDLAHRVARMGSALEHIAKQFLTFEMEEHEHADFEGAYDIMIGVARAAQQELASE